MLQAVIHFSALSTILITASAMSSLPRLSHLDWEPYSALSFKSKTKRESALPGTGVPCLTIPHLTEMKGRFSSHIDPSDDGKAVFEEVRNYLKLFKPSVTDQQVANFIRRRDINGNGIIDFIPEYVMDLTTPDMTPEAAEEWFGLEDSNGDGFVTRHELTRIAQQLGLTPEQADDNVSSYYMSYDKNGDDQLAFEEYKALYGQ